MPDYKAFDEALGPLGQNTISGPSFERPACFSGGLAGFPHHLFHRAKHNAPSSV
jgi:hypothetical protein